MENLPYDIFEAMIQCFGRCFWYKPPLENFFLNCGVPPEIARLGRDEAKFKWSRTVLTELSKNENGILIQRKLLTELCKLKNLPDKEVPDRDAGLKALKELKNLALSQKLYAEELKEKENSSKNKHLNNVQLTQAKSAKLNELKSQLINLHSENNRQKAGFALEKILKELFLLSEIEFKGSYKVESVEQIDGFFKFNSFDYLLEAKWTKDLPDKKEIDSFKGKIQSKLKSTRGLFISINGFRKEVIERFSFNESDIIFIDGGHLSIVLEGVIELIDLLELVVSKAAQEGVVYTPINELYQHT